MLNIEHQASSIKHQGSSIKDQASRIKHQGSSIAKYLTFMRPTATNTFSSELQSLLYQKYGADGPAQVDRYLRLSFYKQITLIEKVLGLRPGARVLDVGCGTGQFLVEASVRGYRIVGVDTFEELEGIDLQIARARAREANCEVQLIHGNASALPFNSGRFDLVTNFGMLEHIPRSARSEILQELFRVVRPGGYLFVIAGPNRSFPYDQHLPKIPFANWLPYKWKIAASKRVGNRLLLNGPWSVSRGEFRDALGGLGVQLLNLYGVFLSLSGKVPTNILRRNPLGLLSYYKQTYALHKLFGMIGHILTMIGLEHCHIVAFRKIN